ncbi:alpha/beta hydrolase [candidate division WWE3 bacterium]|nr:alpha/beta hydrolase [candidate division WWE3 bacterium]
MPKWVKFLALFMLLVVTSIVSFFLIPKDKPNTNTAVELLEVPKDLSDIQPNIGIEYLRNLKVDSEAPEIVQELPNGPNYKRYIASYISEGNKIYGLLTVPNAAPPENGFGAIIFVHGYIPPKQYKTTEKYTAYVDYLARNNFVVFKIDLRGNGDSEGAPTGSYFSPDYTIDIISAAKSLSKLNIAPVNKIGVWGHSMAGNAILRAMLVDSVFKAGVIWAGAVYSYEDFSKYRLNDSSYVRGQTDPHYDSSNLTNNYAPEIVKLRTKPDEVDFNDKFWSLISLTKNIKYLVAPVQIHHAIDDSVVNIGYSKDLVKTLSGNNKTYEFYEYDGGGHNINSPYFEQAMERTIEFFKRNLK